MKLFVLFFLTLLFAGQKAIAQIPAPDTTREVEILPGAKSFTFKRIGNIEYEILVGNVRVRQGTTLFYCDSFVNNKSTRTFEAFGNVHINDSDTAHVYANYLRYHLDTRLAFLKGNVRLTDGHGTLTTNDLEYDVSSKTGTYKNGGKVVTKGSVLTSKEGVYYTDVKEVYFKRNVELKDPAYYLKTDSLIYNTETQLARFVTDTYMKDSSNRVIRTKEGYYDMKGRNAVFTQRTSIDDGALRIVGDEIASDDATGIVQIRGNGVLIDTAQGISILANEIFANKKTAAYLATKKPLMIIKQNNDSIYITADTLFSARLSDLFPNGQKSLRENTVKDSASTDSSLVKISTDTATVIKTDSIAIIKTPADSTSTIKKINLTNSKKEDSTNRYFEAFRNVRVFTDSLQTSSDSLFYSFKDSTFQLFFDPIVWSNKSQITGDTIYLFTKNKKADRIKVFENSFLINEVEPGIYNQIKSIRMDGFFMNGKIDSVRANGSSESIYFLQDRDSAYSGIDETQSESMDVIFRYGKLFKVVFRSNVKGTIWPMSHKKPSEMRLPDFEWQENRRPKAWYELLE